MIRLKRVRSPEVIPAKYREPARRTFFEKLCGTAKEGKAAPDSDYWHDAKAQLAKESHGKCAYCEAAVTVTGCGDVEHFRPKSTYWWLAYCWDNWLFSCQICNELYKRDAFPIRGPRLKVRVPSAGPDPLEERACTTFAKDLARERALLVNPYFEDPEALFAWRSDEALREVEIVAAREEGRAREALEAVVELYGLNREPLRRRRFLVLAELRLLVKLAGKVKGALGEEVRQELARMVGAEGEFAAMGRFFLREGGVGEQRIFATAGLGGRRRIANGRRGVG